MTCNLTYGIMVFEWYHTIVLTHSQWKNYTAEFLQQFVVVVVFLLSNHPSDTISRRNLNALYWKQS